MSVSFEYKARDGGGAVKTGVLPGASSAAVAKELSRMGLAVIDVRAKGAGKAFAAGGATAASASTAASPGVSSAALNTPSWLARLRRPSEKKLQQGLSLVMREMAALLRAGVPLMRSLQLAADSAADAEVGALLQRITRDLDNGHNLVTAAEREHRASGMLSLYDVAMLQVGEQTGRLPEAFADLHRYREFTRSTNEQVSSALRYPMFVIITCLLAVVIVNIFVLPQFARVFAQARTELPLLTRVLMGMSRAMLVGWPVALIVVVAGVVGWKRWLATRVGELWWDKRKLRLPIVGRILEGIVIARLTSSLASSISAGLTITDALTVTGRTLGNAWYESRVQQMCSELARGASITAAARNMAVLPPTLLQLFAIGEESGALEELMREISVHYQSEVDYAIKQLSATLEPILIWFLGMGILVLALGVFMPMWDLGKASIK